MSSASLLQTTDQFIGGKMFHLFKLEKGSYQRESVMSVEETLEIFNTSEWFVKIDGGNGVLLFNEETGKYDLYKRFDRKFSSWKSQSELPENTFPISNANGNVAEYFAGSFTHVYHQQLVPRNPRKPDKVFRDIYRQIDHAQSEGRFGDRKVISVEIVGPNYCQTPKVPVITLAIHSEQVIEKPQEEFKTIDEIYSYLENYFKENVIEGIVFKYKGVFHKILADCFKIDGVSVSKWGKDGYKDDAPAPRTIMPVE